MKDLIIKKLNTKQAVIGIFGLGYVGLPLSLRFAEAGFKVLGFDIDHNKAEKLNRGISYIEHIPSCKVAEANMQGFEATTDFARASGADALILCVPTPLNKYREPDLSFVTNTTNMACRIYEKAKCCRWKAQHTQVLRRKSCCHARNRSV